MSQRHSQELSALARNGHSGNETSTGDSSTTREEHSIPEIFSTLEDLQRSNRLTQTEAHTRLATARSIVASLNSSSFLDLADRYDDQVWIITQLQNIAYHDAVSNDAQDIAQWCVRAYLQLLAQNRTDDSPEVLMGLGQAWLLRAQRVTARIHRQEGSSSSGDSGGPRSASQAHSYTSSEDAREAARQIVEADARAGGPDYVEARGMLLPATEYLQRATTAAERAGRLTGNSLALAAEAFISLGNVSYTHHSEHYFQQAVRCLQQAMSTPGYLLSPYLQSYFEDFGRFVP